MTDLQIDLLPLSEVSLEERLKRVVAVVEGISLMADMLVVCDDEDEKSLLQYPESLLRTAMQLSKDMGMIYSIVHGITPHGCCRDSDWMRTVESLERDFVEGGVMNPKRVLDSWSNENQA